MHTLARAGSAQKRLATQHRGATCTAEPPIGPAAPRRLIDFSHHFDAHLPFSRVTTSLECIFVFFSPLCGICFRVDMYATSARASVLSRDALACPRPGSHSFADSSSAESPIPRRLLLFFAENVPSYSRRLWKGPSEGSQACRGRSPGVRAPERLRGRLPRVALPLHDDVLRRHGPDSSQGSRHHEEERGGQAPGGAARWLGPRRSRAGETAFGCLAHGDALDVQVLMGARDVSRWPAPRNILSGIFLRAFSGRLL